MKALLKTQTPPRIISPKTAVKSISKRSQKRFVLYARVSTQEQDKGQYPSCESQIEELEAYCIDKGWHIAERIQDGGHRAGTLLRPGLTHLRYLVTSGQVEGV